MSSAINSLVNRNDPNVDWLDGGTEKLEQHDEETAGNVTGENFSLEPQDTGNGERLVQKYGKFIRWIAETNE